jgi:hypothetical protein
MLNLILTILIWLAIGLLVSGVGIGIYALLFVKNDPWGWREIGEELEQQAPRKEG